MLKIKTLIVILGTFAAGELLLAVAGYVTLVDQKADQVTAVESDRSDSVTLQPAALSRWHHRIEKWRAAREAGDIALVYAMYAHSFKEADGTDLNDLKRESAKHLKEYNWRNIAIDRVKITATEGHRTVKFRERYNCAGFFRIQQRMLQFARLDSVWKIVAASDSDLIPVQKPDQFIPQFVFKWRDASESTDFQKYIAMYDSSFHTANYDYDSWLNYKRSVFRETEEIRVDVSDFEFTNIGPERWKVTFVQRYISPDYEDWGRKVIKIQGVPGAFRIYSEIWIPMETYVQ